MNELSWAFKLLTILHLIIFAFFGQEELWPVNGNMFFCFSDLGFVYSRWWTVDSSLCLSKCLRFPFSFFLFLFASFFFFLIWCKGRNGILLVLYDGGGGYISPLSIHINQCSTNKHICLVMVRFFHNEISMWGNL